jgi:hypothetical protein
MTQRIVAFALLLSTACWLSAQQAPPEPSAVFSSETKLVLVPFNVVQGTHFVAGLKQEDVLLHEDGKPRDFSIFEGPAAPHRSRVELVLLFDTTTLSEVESKSRNNASGWNRKATYDFTNHWGDVESRALLEDGLADVRISVYRFDHQQLQRLCRSTSDPGTLTNALHQLQEPIPAGEAIPLGLPPGRQSFRQSFGSPLDPKNPVVGPTPGWTLEAVIDTLKDSAAAPNNAIRVLVPFTQGAGPTFTTTQDAASQAIALGMPVYPVVLDFYKYYRTPVIGTALPADGSGGAPTPVQVPGACKAEAVPNGSVCGGPTYPLEKIADVGALTGGRAFYPRSLDQLQVSVILKAIRNEGLSQYVVGFAPPASGRQKKHNLEIGLQSKSIGSVTGGKKTAVY